MKIEGIILVIIMILFIIFILHLGITSRKILYEKYKIPDTVYIQNTEEAKCYNLCNGKYFYDKNLIGGDTCVCGN